MQEALELALAAPAGLLLGTLFFGGLWWTVRRGMSSSRPALWFAGSLLLRMSLAAAGLCWVAGGSWQRLVLCLAGFVLARFLVTRWTRQAAEAGPCLAGQARSAGAAGAAAAGPAGAAGAARVASDAP